MSTLARKLMAAAAGAVAILDVPGTPVTYSEATGTLTQFDVPLVTGSQVGELALLEFSANGSITVTPPSGSVTMFTASNSGTYDSVRIFGKILDSTDITNGYLRVTVSAANRAVGIMRRVTGNRPNIVLNTDYAIGTEVLAASATTVDPPSLTPAWGSARNLWIAIGSVNDSNTAFSSYPSGYPTSQANILAGSAGNGAGLASCCKLATAASDDPGVFTWSNAKAHIGLTLAIRPR